ncbi:MAG: ABC transporter permease [Propionibacteriaceae bacterium]|jgi:peptide/nickel transport system permease protein|nr:ABC transporter permease [Propionibacteriaceae bacterium]
MSLQQSTKDTGEFIDQTTEQDTGKRHTRLALYVKRFRRNVPAVIGLAVFLVLVLVAAFGWLLTPYAIADIDFMALSQPPNPTHWFGTNSTGLDLYSMTVHGLGRSLIIALAVAGLTIVIAAFLGALAAYRGGKTEAVILGVVNFLLVCPVFLLEAVIAQKSGGSWVWLIFVLTLFGWMVTARVIWQLSTSIREREYIAAARYMGVPGIVVVLRHMVPNIGSLLVVQFVLGIVSTVMSETALSFLGFGIKIPDVSLGSLLMDGQKVLSTTPWAFFFPAGTMMLLTVSVALMADGLRDALDPNSAAGGRA